jgi:secreted Zn-dependent insulinase-like peptidase
MADTLLSPLQLSPAFTALPLTQRPRTTVAQLPPATVHIFRKAAPSAAQGNSAIELLLQCGADAQPQASVLELVLHLVREPAFDQLRTKEALGYLVHTGSAKQGGYIRYYTACHIRAVFN